MASPDPDCEMATFLGKVFMALASDYSGLQLEKLKYEIKRDHRINPEETAQDLGFESFSAFLDSAEASNCVLKENITNQYGVPVCIYKAKPTGTYLPVFQQQKTAEDQAREKKQRQERNYMRNYQAAPAPAGRSTSDNYQQRSYNNTGHGWHQPPRQQHHLVNIRPCVQPKQEMAIAGKYYRGQGEPEGIEDFADEIFEEDYQDYRAPEAANNNDNKQQQQQPKVAGTSTSAMGGESTGNRNESVKQEQQSTPTATTKAANTVPCFQNISFGKTSATENAAENREKVQTEEGKRYKGGKPYHFDMSKKAKEDSKQTGKGMWSEESEDEEDPSYSVIPSPDLYASAAAGQRETQRVQQQQQPRAEKTPEKLVDLDAKDEENRSNAKPGTSTSSKNPLENLQRVFGTINFESKPKLASSSRTPVMQADLDEPGNLEKLGQFVTAICQYKSPDTIRYYELLKFVPQLEPKFMDIQSRGELEAFFQRYCPKVKYYDYDPDNLEEFFLKATKK